MAWRFGDTFRHYGTATVPLAKWNGGFSRYAIKTTGGRDDGPCLELNFGTFGVRGWFAAANTDTIDEMVAGTRFKPADAPVTIMQFRHFANNAVHVTIGLDSLQRVCAWRGTQTSGVLLATGRAIPLNSYTYVEAKVKVSDAAGTVEVRLNGSPTPEFALTAQDTCTGVTPLITHFSLGHYAPTLADSISSIYSSFHCDFYLCDTTGPDNNDFLGELRGDLMLPDAPGANQDFTPSTGSDHEAVIDEVPPSATDYLESSVTGDKDTHTVTPLTGIDNIVAVQINNWFFKSDAGYAAGRSLLVSGATEDTGVTLAAPLDPIYQLDSWELDPNTSAAWTLANLNAIEIGTENVT